MKKVAVLTEGRQDYGIYIPVLKAIQACHDLELNLIVTGMHHEENFGASWKEIKKDGFEFLEFGEDDYWPLSIFIKDSDWLIVLGDRMPMLEACIDATKLGIPICHIQGGDVTTGATIDEPIRHAITRLAHLHFPSQRSSARRLIRWGEEAWRIKVVGPLGIFNMQNDLKTPIEIRSELGIEKQGEYYKPIILVVQHPVKDSLNYTWQMLFTIAAVKDLGEVVIIYPNSDDGGQEMIDAIQTHWKGKAFKNLPYLTFQSLLKASSVLVGNSSIALHEAPLHGIPCVSIGDRELGREMWGYVEWVPYDARAIREAVKYALNRGKAPPLKRKEIDGPGIIIKTLLETPINEKLLRKGYR